MGETELMWIRFMFDNAMAEGGIDLRQAVCERKMTIHEILTIMCTSFLDDNLSDSCNDSMRLVLANLDQAAVYAAGILGLT